MSVLGGTVKLTGESEYKKALSEITSNLKVLNSEMKAVTSQYDKNDSSAENLSSQNDVLNKMIEEQEKKVSLLKEALEKSRAETGDNSKATKNWQIDLNNAQAELNNLNRQVENNIKAMEEAEESTEDEAETVKDYEKALSEITSNLKLLDKEMQLVTSQYDKNDTSVEKLSEQNEILNSTIAEQERKVRLLKEALEDSVVETGGNSEATKKWRAELYDAEIELNKLNRKIDDNARAFADAVQETQEEAEAVEDFGKEADKSGDKALSLGDIIKANLISDAIIGGLSALGNAVAGIGNKFSEFLAFGEETKEIQTQMAKLDAAFENAGHDLDYATDTVYALQGVLGDTGRSVEASNLLSKMSSNSEDLEANTRILTGVFAQFGDNIPTEGLAEGMQATAQMGSVQGVLADALEWQGVNLDKYNEKLEAMTSAEERASYIQSTLTDLYGASADAYRENNQALIESNEAQLRYEQHLAEIGKLAVPLQTDINNLSSHLMMGFLPALDSVMPSVQALSSSFLELTKAVIHGGDGAAEMALVSVSENMHILVENLKEFLPEVAEIAMSLVDVLGTVITDNLPYIVEAGADLVSELLSGISGNIGSLTSTALGLVNQLTKTLLENMPAILNMGIQMLVSLIQGISQSLPELTTTTVEAVAMMAQVLMDNLDLILASGIELVITLVHALLDNLDLLIDTGIELIFALADGLLDATPDLLAELPVLVDKLCSALEENLPKLVEAGIELTLKLAAGILEATPQLLKMLPQLVTSITRTLKNSLGSLKTVGKNLVEGIWNGIKDATSWILDKIKGFGSSVLSGIMDFFGIHSPSTVMEDKVGANLAYGVGGGFAKTMEEVSRDMQNAIPTEFDSEINTHFTSVSDHSQLSMLDTMLLAFKQALSEVKVMLDDREMGTFVTDTVEKEVFA